jgi:hypothetical protein
MGYDNLHIMESIASIKFWTLTSIFFYYTINSHLVSNMGCVSKFQSIEIQNQSKPPFNIMDLMWTKDVRHGGAYIIEVECTYMSHA